MIYSIQSKVIKDSKILQNYASIYPSNVELTVAQIKQLCKNKIVPMPVYDNYITKEILYLGNNEKSNDQEVIKPKSGLEYNLIFDKVIASGSVTPTGSLDVSGSISTSGSIL